MCDAVLRGERPQLPAEMRSGPLAELFERGWAHAPEERPTAAEFHDTLQRLAMERKGLVGVVQA